MTQAATASWRQRLVGTLLDAKSSEPVAYYRFDGQGQEPLTLTDHKPANQPGIENGNRAILIGPFNSPATLILVFQNDKGSGGSDYVVSQILPPDSVRNDSVSMISVFEDD